MKRAKYHTVPFPKFRHSSLDAGRLGRHKHIVHALIELDVTIPRQFILKHQQKTGKKLSFTSFVIYCLGKAIEQHPHLHAYLNWRHQLVIYEEVNIGTMIEVEKAGMKVPMPHIFKSVNHKTFREIHDELRAVQKSPIQHKGAYYIDQFLKLPWLLRRIFYWFVMNVPQSFRQYSSQVLVTSVGMFGNGAGWGIPKPSYTLTLTLGGIAKKPAVVNGSIEIRDILNLTLSINHDIVDGAPAARFTKDLKELIENGYGLAGEISDKNIESKLLR